MKVLYYAHNQGSGHLRHAANVADIAGLDVTVVGASEPPLHLPAGTEFRQLSSDAVDGYRVDPAAPFHYTPTGVVIKRRFAELHKALLEFEPDVVMVDVSAEVAAFVKLCGFRTVVRRMHGRRTDLAHTNMYALADEIVAYFPESIEDESYSMEFREKTTYVGMLAMNAPPLAATANRSIVVLTGLGGTGVNVGDVETAARQTLNWNWTIVGLCNGTSDFVKTVGVVDDPSPFIANAAVTICATGHNAVRTAAAFGKSIVFMPEPRPYDEQEVFAQAIAQHVSIPVVDSWQQDWPHVLLSAGSASQLRDLLFVHPADFAASISSVVGRLTTSSDESDQFSSPMVSNCDNQPLIGQLPHLRNKDEAFKTISSK